MSATPGSDWTNARLVEECLRGNERAWHVLIDRYKNLIYSIPLRYGVPHQDAADIFQRVCLDLFNELPRLRDAEALQAWLIRVTTHKCYHWKRRQSSLESEWTKTTWPPARRTRPPHPTWWPNSNGSNWFRRRLRSSRRGAGR